MYLVSMKILITGGAGFIGANLAAYYLKQGNTVTVLDNLSRKNVIENVKWLETINPSNFKLVTQDIRNYDGIKEVVKKQDVIFHEAAQTAVTTSLIHPRYDFEENALGTFNVLEAVREKNPETILFYASTNKVYGGLDDLKLRATEFRYQPASLAAISETRPLDFHTPYGCSKGTADQYVRDYSRSYKIKTVVFRQSCIYGEHQFGVEDQGWVAHFTSQVIKGLPITIYGNGKQVRDLLFIDDLVAGYDKALKAIDKTAGQVFNMGGGLNHTASLLEVITFLEKIKGSPLDLSYRKTRNGDQKYYVSDITKAKKVFGWTPKISVDKGINRLYKWLTYFIKNSAV